ncbi:MAG: DUF4908 domain-containing protein [Pseudomonadota bacterium]|nr:DUF4908 domain-containing protein [Pseudomonadota bacterium]
MAGVTGAALFALAGALAPAPAAAGFAFEGFQINDDPFASLVGKRREREERRAGQPEIERYVTTSGDREFLLENDGDEARIKFLCSEDDPRLDCRIDPEGPAEEIFLLTPTRGSRGDLLFRDSSGETVLRIAAHGGATVHWPGELVERGASKSYTDETGPLSLSPARRSAAHRRAQGAAAHLSALTGSPIVFDVGLPFPPPAAIAAAPVAVPDFARQAYAPASENRESDPEDALPRRRDAGVLADAVARVAGGMHMVAADPTGARVIGARIAAVKFVEAETAGLSLDGAVLTVFYNPEAGLAGRPSSTAVAKYLEESL